MTVTAEMVRDLLQYDASTGEMRWARHVSARARKGNIAGCVAGRYRVIGIEGRYYQFHNIVWLYVHGRWPNEIIDHINRDGLDNRLINLREATRGENQANRRKPRNNTSGFKGVLTHYGRWYAQFRGKHLGYFPSAEAAAAAYEAAARRAYGEFVTL